MSITTPPLKLNKKKENITPEEIWLLQEICRTRKQKLEKGPRKIMCSLDTPENKGQTKLL
jgi:hypothetical protein